MLPKGYLLGNVAGDPQTGLSQNTQKQYARFSVACDDRFSRPNENPRTHFFNLVAWGRNAQFVEGFIKKGDRVFIEFTLSTSTYVNSEGKQTKSVDLHTLNIEKLSPRSAPKSEGSSSEENTPIPEETDEISLDDLF